MRFLAMENPVSEILNVGVIVIVLAVVVFSIGLTALAASACASAYIRRQRRENRVTQLRAAHAKQVKLAQTTLQNMSRDARHTIEQMAARARHSRRL